MSESGKEIILTGGSATAAERHAAAELRGHLARIAFPESGRLHFAVGPEAAMAAGAKASDWRGLGDEGYVIRRAGDTVILSGAAGSKRGTLYAVSVFLERIMGCRWWAPDASFIPPKAKRIPASLAIREVPVFEYREALYRQSWDAKWCARNRTNGLWEIDPGGVPPDWGGSRHYAGFVHTLIGLVPPEKVAAHPEWQAVVDGKPDPGQLCLSRPEVLAETIRGARKRLREKPDAELISVSQMDNHVYCQCRRCAAVDAKAGSPAGSLLRFVNKVAAALEKTHPHVAVDTLAYFFSRQPPTGVRPRRNVIVRLCTIECDFLHPLDHVNNRAFMRHLEGWSKICKRLYIWDYTTNYAHHVLPHPNWFVLAKNMRIFRAHSVKGIFEQGNQSSRGGEFAELKAWVLAKLMWNPDLDAEALIREFLAGYYGAAAGPIGRYMRRVHGAAMRVEHYTGSQSIRACLKKRDYPEGKTGAYLDLNAEPEAPWLTPRVVLGGLADFADAHRRVKGEPALAARVALARLPLEYAVLLRWNEMRAAARKRGWKWPLAGTRVAAFASFEKIGKENGITHLGEGWTKRDWPWLEKIANS
jgi:hypothetical protein